MRPLKYARKFCHGGTALVTIATRTQYGFKLMVNAEKRSLERRKIETFGARYGMGERKLSALDLAD